MTPTWQSDDSPPMPAIGWSGRLIAVVRGTILIVVILFGVLFSLFLRLFELAFCGQARPLTGRITVLVCQLAIRVLGLRYRQVGKPMRYPGLVVANHSSWLDIFVLNSAAPLVFVSKAEVASWPGIGFLARLTGTVFVRRERREADQQKTEFEKRLKHGHRLLFFPEGTSTDNQRVLPFKPTLFAAAFSETLRPELWVQPVSVIYTAPKGRDARFYGWWGDMEFGSHLGLVLAQWPQGAVEVVWHEPVRVSDFADRKALSRAVEVTVRDGHTKMIKP